MDSQNSLKMLFNACQAGRWRCHFVIKHYALCIICGIWLHISIPDQRLSNFTEVWRLLPYIVTVNAYFCPQRWTGPVGPFPLLEWSLTALPNSSEILFLFQNKMNNTLPHSNSNVKCACLTCGNYHLSGLVLTNNILILDGTCQQICPDASI